MIWWIFILKMFLACYIFPLSINYGKRNVCLTTPWDKRDFQPSTKNEKRKKWRKNYVANICKRTCRQFNLNQFPKSLRFQQQEKKKELQENTENTKISSIEL